ncbi:MAG TPA: thiamine pyrophosphate-dependent enzyme, partial [Ktedonobacteraceae bacterium]|nr:thiamine pyrophosphate-dependent enzyme [Ktedonobacteraceae bacterium]
VSAFAARLNQAGLIDELGLQQMEEQVDQEVEHAVQFAEQSPDPPVEGLFDYIYAPAETSSGGE